MKQLQRYLSVLCALTLASSSFAQQKQDTTPRLQDDRPHWYSGVTKRWESMLVPPINTASSGRADQLLRAGNLYLSLRDAVALALENNIDIEVARYQYPLLQAALLLQQSGNGLTPGSNVPSFDPVLTSTVNFLHQTTPQQNTVTTGTTSLVTNSKVANFGVTQGFYTGGTATLSYNNTNTQQNAYANLFNPATSSALDLQITQPLLNGFGLAMNQRGIKIAQANLKAADYTVQQQVITTVSTVVQAYWNLVAAIDNVRVQEQAVALAQKLYDDNKKQVDIGTLAPLELTKAQAQIATSRQALVLAQGTVRQQETSLKNLLSRNGILGPSFTDSRVIPTDTVTIPEVEPVTPIQDLWEHAIATRPDLMTTRVAIDVAQLNIKGIKNNMLPTINAIGDVRNNALSGNPNNIANPNTKLSYAQTCAIPGGVCPADPFFVGGYGDVLGQLFRRNFPTYSLGATLSVPLRNRSNIAAMEQAYYNERTQELGLQKQVNQVRTDIQNAIVGVQVARESYAAAVESRILEEQTLDAEQKKYALGTSTPYLVVQIQRDLAAAQQSEVAARANYALAKNTLDVAAGMVLDRNNIQFEEAKSGKVTRAPSPIPAGK